MSTTTLTIILLVFVPLEALAILAFFRWLTAPQERRPDRQLDSR